MSLAVEGLLGMLYTVAIVAYQCITCTSCGPLQNNQFVLIWLTTHVGSAAGFKDLVTLHRRTLPIKVFVVVLSIQFVA